MLKSEEITSRLTGSLKSLHLPTVRTSYAESALVARREGHSYERYLLELIELECEDRQYRRVERLRRASKLPMEKTMESFELDLMPEKVRQQIGPLLEGGFLGRTENILELPRFHGHRVKLVLMIVVSYWFRNHKGSYTPAMNATVSGYTSFQYTRKYQP